MPLKGKLLIAAPLSPENQERLRALFPGLTVIDGWNCRERISEEIADAEYLYGRINSEQYERATRLTFIQSPTRGVDRLMFPELRQSPVRMANAGGLYSPAIAEHVVMLILALFRNLPAYIRWQDEARWNPEALHFRLLQGATVGHLGTGSISQHTARLCAALGCRNRGFSRSGRPVEPFDEVVGERGLPELLRASDVVVNALPYTPETHHLMDAARFKMMKCDAIFINVGRGATVDEAALVEALENGTIAGAGLDVFEREPLPPESRLWRMPNVIVTSHRSGMGIDEDNALFDILVENLSRLESGKPLLNEVDKERGY